MQLLKNIKTQIRRYKNIVSSSVAVKYFDLYYFLSQQDIKNRFRRSYLGIGWLVVQQLVFALFTGIIWSTILATELSSFIPALVIGITIWNFIVVSMVESCTIFINVRGYLKQFTVPQSVFILKFTLTNCYYLLIGLMVAIMVLFCCGKFSLIGMLYGVPGLLILIVYFYVISRVMAYLGLRYRDIQHALNGIISLLFMVTPIVFPSEVLVTRGMGFALYMNPFASLIDIVRYPLTHGEFAPLGRYIGAVIFVILIKAIQVSLINKWQRYIPFWV